MAERLELSEQAGALGDTRRTQAVNGRFRALLIREGWGSSGHYSEALLKRDGPAAWPSGTFMYLDHPTVTESEDRPERSVRDVASVLVTDPVWDAKERGLVAEVQVFPQWRDLLNEDFAKKIGLSIRATGTVEHGEAEGRAGYLVTSLGEGLSVDWVTQAGAGGRVLELIESARAISEGRHGANWREEQHPRGYHGRFGSGTGGEHSGGGSGKGGSSGDGSPTGGPAGGPGGERAGRGMPHTITAATLNLSTGGDLTLERDMDGSVTIGTSDGHATLTREQARALDTAMSLSDDWDDGESESIDGVGTVTKTGKGQYEVALDDGPAFTAGRRDAVKFEQALERLDSASRVDTGYGDIDVFSPDRRKIGFRMLGDDGRPVEAVFDKSSWTKVTTAIDRIIDDADDPDITDPKPTRTVTTNLGKVDVTVTGLWGARDPDARVRILPQEGDWGIVVDGSQERDWSAAVDKAGVAGGVIESRRPPSSVLTERATTMAEARNIGGWIESRLHLALTQLADDMYGEGRLTRDERISLSGAVGAALDAFTTTVEASAPQLYQRDLYDPPETADAQMGEAGRRLLEASDLTANDLRDLLCASVKDSYGGKDIYVWVRDWTDTWVAFSLESDGDSGLYQQEYTVADRTVTLTGQPVEVTATTTYQPVPDQGDGTGQGSPPAPVTESQKGEGSMPELTEEQAAQLAEAAKTKTALDEAIARLNAAGDQITALTERADKADARAEAADAKTQSLENDRAARALVAEALATSGLPAASHTSVTGSACRDLPLTEAGALDVDTFKPLIETAVTAKKTELAALMEESGIGTVRGLGESHGAATEPLTESAFEDSLSERFQRLGMTTDAAKIAATGRR